MTHSHFRRTLTRGGFFGLLAASSSIASAQVTWDGGGAPDGNFNNALNWTGDVAPTGPTTFNFEGGANLSATNNIALTASDSTINFGAGASAFTLWGNVIRVGGVNNNSAVAQTIMQQLRVNGTRTVNVGAAGLMLGTPMGSTGSSGRSVNKTGAGALTLFGNATGSLVTYNVNEGSLVFLNSAEQTTSITAGNVVLANATTLAFNTDGNVVLGGITANSGSAVELNGAGTINASGAVSINSGATLRGAGTMLGTTTILGTVSPGDNSIGTLSLGVLSLDASAIVAMDIDRDAAQNGDLISTTGALAFGGTLSVNNMGGALQIGDAFDLFDFDSSSGDFASFNLPSLDPSMQWDFNPDQGVLSVIAIPEPSAAALLLLASGLLARRVKRS